MRFAASQRQAVIAEDIGMRGLMQEHGLLISTVIRHAAAKHGEREIVSREADGSCYRTNYREVERRSRLLAAVLAKLGVRQGDRVATLAMNTFRHLECYFGVSGMGAVLHTVNPRLFAEQITWIVNHAESRVLLFDPFFLPLVESIAPELRTIRAARSITAARSAGRRAAHLGCAAAAAT